MSDGFNMSYFVIPQLMEWTLIICMHAYTYSVQHLCHPVCKVTVALKWLILAHIIQLYFVKIRIYYVGTVYPKKYSHGFTFAVLCCGYTLTDFPISIRLTSLALWQSIDCPSASKATLVNMDKYFMWIHYERLHNHNKAKHNKTVCIFLGIYCIIVWYLVRVITVNSLFVMFTLNIKPIPHKCQTLGEGIIITPRPTQNGFHVTNGILIFLKRHFLGICVNEKSCIVI